MRKSDYLDPLWQQFRLKRLEASDWTCESCNSTTDTLHVHHHFYISGRKPWEYLPETTSVFCKECHEVQHELDSDFSLGATKWEKLVAEGMTADRCVVGGFEEAIKLAKSVVIPLEWIEQREAEESQQ